MLKKSRINWALALTLMTGLFMASALAQYPSESEPAPADGRQPPPSSRGTIGSQQQRAAYHESALRRFEIVTLVSLPFTVIHSYLAVRGVKMVQQNEFSPELTGKDFRVVGAGAVSFALFIGFWDWLHTHDKDPSQPLIPSSPEPGPRRPQAPSREVGLKDWDIDDDANALSLPLIQIRF